MPDPRFSVLIPTRERPDTLRHTLQTVIDQPGDDYEVVVADNCGGPETRRLVEELRLAKVIHTRSEEVLPMSVNWERGLELCKGEYVTVLGDDDAFLPSTLETARALIDSYSPEILSWNPHSYLWPDTVVHWARNILVVNLGTELVENSSRAVLERFYREQANFDYVPSIYKGFYHRDVIADASMRFDGFFVPADTAPDISSAVLGLHITGSFLHCGRPLSIRGNSRKSTGTAHWARSLGAAQREIYYREERVGLAGFIHPALIPSPDIIIAYASVKLKCRDLYFPDDPVLAVDPRAVLEAMLETINFEPEAYEEKLHDIRQLAVRLGLVLDPAGIPPMQPQERRPLWGPQIEPDGKISHVRVNCDLLAVHDIAAAARVAESMVHPTGYFLAGRVKVEA